MYIYIYTNVSVHLLIRIIRQSFNRIDSNYPKGFVMYDHVSSNPHTQAHYYSF